MPDFTAVFKDEVRRLARKEIKDTSTKLRNDVVQLKKTIADQKRRIARLERDNKRFARVANAKREDEVTPEPTEIESARVSGKMIRNLRDRLGLTQAEMAALLGVSGQSVYQWERSDGRLNLRQTTKAAVVEARKLGAREARRRLETM
jgi:DNA-binding transcriptional regulator YiaG